MIELFPQTRHVETVVLMGRKNSTGTEYAYLDYEPSEDIEFKGSATYAEIKAWILENYGFKVSSLYVAQIKDKCGIKEYENYNKPKSEGDRVPICPKEKEDAIKEAFKHFWMID